MKLQLRFEINHEKASVQLSYLAALGFDGTLLPLFAGSSHVVPGRLVDHLQELEHAREVLLGRRMCCHLALLLDHVEERQHLVEVLRRHAPQGRVQRLPLHPDAAPHLSDKSLVAHDERLGLGDAAVAAGDDDDQADCAEDGEAGWAVHWG